MLLPLRRSFLFCLFIGACLLAPTAGLGAQAKTFGFLTTDSGDLISDLEVAQLIEQHFEDGSRGNGTVDSNIVVLATQSFGGSFAGHFDAFTGPDDDPIAFTNTTFLSATQPGRATYQGGYYTGAQSALLPGVPVNEVHAFGIGTKDVREEPFHSGSLDRLVAGNTSTHLLIWADSPSADDQQTINTVVSNLSGIPGFTSHVLAGNGSVAQGTSHVTGPATRAALTDAIQEIGALMDDGPTIADEQFIFFITGRAAAGVFDPKTDPIVVPPSTSPPGVVRPLPLDAGMVADLMAYPDNSPNAYFAPLNPLSPQQESGTGVDVNANFLGVLQNAPIRRQNWLNPALPQTYGFPITEEVLLLNASSGKGDFGLTNFGSAPLTFHTIGFDTGAVGRLPATAAPPSDCDAEDVLCFQDDRFQAKIQWGDFQGGSGSGQMVKFGSDDSGLFWFFERDNWEMLIKVLDGCAINQHYWVFAAATTNVEYTLTVTDTLSGNQKTYFNPLGTRSRAITDTSAFDVCFFPIQDDPQIERVQPQPQATPSVTLTATAPKLVSARRAMVSGILYEQIDQPATTGTTSQDFGAPLDAFDTQVADDFTLPPGTWSIDTVEVTGLGESNGELNVYFYSDNNGRPGNEIFRAQGLRPPGGLESGGQFKTVTLDLATPAIIPGGTTWLSVEAVMDTVGDQWVWNDRIPRTGHPAQFRNPGNGFGSGCTDWQDRDATCFAGTGQDQIFTLRGTEHTVTGCTPTPTNACLSNRFSVQVTWKDFEGGVGPGTVVPTTSNDSGLFWFFNANNWELLIKTLDGCAISNTFWVFAAATTNVEYTLTVTDTQTGATRQYFNPLGVASPTVADTNAFACP